MITPLHTIEPVYFSKNRILHHFKVNPDTTTESRSKLIMPIYLYDHENYIQLSNDFINVKYNFTAGGGESTATEKELPTFNPSQMGISKHSYFESVIKKALAETPNLLKYYRLEVVDWSGHLELHFTALQAGSQFDIEIVDQSGNITAQSQAFVPNEVALHLEADIHYSITDSIHSGGIYEGNLTYATTIKGQLDSENQTFINLNRVVNSFIKPELALVKPKETPINNAAIVYVSVNTVNSDTNAILGTYTYSFIAIYGACRDFLDLSQVQEYYADKEVVPKLLTTTTNGHRIYPYWINIYDYINKYILESVNFGSIQKTFTVQDEEVVELDYDHEPHLTLNREIIARPRMQFILSENEYIATITPTNGLTTPLTYGEPLMLVKDSTPYTNNNFFVFYNSLGGRDIAWLTGETSINYEPNNLTYKSTLTTENLIHQVEEHTVAQNAGITIKINTGLKTKEEIETFKELIFSEKIAWFTEENWRTFIETNDWREGNPSIIAKYLYVTPLNKDITIKPEENNMFSFDFEFRLATEIASPTI